VFGWLAKAERNGRPVAAGPAPSTDVSKVRQVIELFRGARSRLAARVLQLNQLTGDEVSAAAGLLNDIVERARAYVNDSQRAISMIDGRKGSEGVGQLIGTQATMLREQVKEMSNRAAAQDERARQAAAAAKSIADLAQSIERLASEARLLAVNARIESSRLGAHSAGFEVLASEMQRLSDEVAGANERVSELAARLGTDLPWIAQHARDLRGAMETFAISAADRLEETERGVNALRTELDTVSKSGNIAMEDILKASRGALSHLQFQDVVAQELRLIDTKLRETHIEIAREMGADESTIAEIPLAEYQTEGGTTEDPQVAPPGDVVMF
jgi:methyl-accepting chemotaxis protein